MVIRKMEIIKEQSSLIRSHLQGLQPSPDKLEGTDCASSWEERSGQVLRLSCGNTSGMFEGH